MEYPNADGIFFDASSNRLGVTRAYSLPYSTEPKVLEYKYTFESLVSDFDKEEKFAKQVNFVVCWTAGSHYKEKFYLQSLLVGDEGSSREIFGATHQAFAAGSSQPAFEVLVVEDLLRWLQDPVAEEARQKHVYRE